jgi:hypothetical protein
MIRLYIIGIHYVHVILKWMVIKKEKEENVTNDLFLKLNVSGRKKRYTCSFMIICEIHFENTK